MTNLLALPNTTEEILDNKEQFLLTADLIKTVAHYEVKMEKSRHQLLFVKRANPNNKIGRKAERFLNRQHKLMEIADELRDRMIAQIAVGSINEEMENQFAEEVELLNWMHFEVTKSYTLFINQNFETRIISLILPMAA